MNKYILVKTIVPNGRSDVKVNKAKCYDSFDDALMEFNRDFSDDCIRTGKIQFAELKLNMDYGLNEAHYRIHIKDDTIYVIDETIMKEE